MNISLKKATALVTVAAMSGLFLAGCANTTKESSSPVPSSSSSPGAIGVPQGENPEEVEVDLASTEDAADFLNKFNDELQTKLNLEDLENTNPPVELNRDQLTQITEGQPVDGISKDDLNKLADFFYETYPLGKYVYFEENSEPSDRISLMLNLTLIQNFRSLQSDRAGKLDKILPEEINIEIGDTPRASVSGNPISSLIFTDGEWKLDGYKLAKEMSVKDILSGISKEWDATSRTAPAE